MGLFRKLFGGSGVNKIKLIKELAKSNLRMNPLMAASWGLDENFVNTLDNLAVMNLPEATIVSIVETYCLLRQQGISEEDALQRIESHRAQWKRGEMPACLNLCNYIKYRLNLENEMGPQITVQFIENTVEICKRRYGLASSEKQLPFETIEAQGTQGEKSGESIEEAIIINAKNDDEERGARVFPQGKTIENKTLFSIENIAELRQRAQEAGNPMALLDVFTSLRIKKEFTLHAFPYSVSTGGVGNVWAVPLSVPLRDSEEWEKIDLWETPRPFPIDDSCLDGLGDPGELIIPRPPSALDNIMEAIEGNGTLWSYLSASIFAREIAEFGANWHGAVWSTHTILRGDPWACPHDWEVNEEGPSSEQDWHWLCRKPSEWSPSVIRNDEVIIVKFYTFTALVGQAIYCYTDTYKVNNYKFGYDVKKIALGGGGYIF